MQKKIWKYGKKIEGRKKNWKFVIRQKFGRTLKIWKKIWKKLEIWKKNWKIRN